MIAKPTTPHYLALIVALSHTVSAAPIYDSLDSGAGNFLPLDAASWVWSPSAGVNGTGALVNSRSNADTYSYASLPVMLRPQSAFRFSAWLKGATISGADVGSGIILQHVAESGWLSADLPLTWMKGSPTGWQRIEGYGYSDPTETPNKADLALFLNRNMTGTTTFDNIRLEELGNVPAFNSSFDTDLAGWSFQSNEWSGDATGGRNGTAGLMLNRTNSSATGAAILNLPSVGLDFSIPYHFAVWVRGENVQGTGKGGYIDVEFSKPGAWLGWDDSTTGSGSGTSGWQRIEGITTPQRGTTTLQLDLFLSTGMTGKVWFDDLELQPLVTTGNLANFPMISPASTAPVTIVNSDFSNNLNGWDFSATPNSYSHAAGQGTDGSGAIYLSKTDPNPWVYAYQVIQLQPGIVYTVSADIKTAGVSGSGKGAYIGIDHNGPTGWLGGDSTAGLTTATTDGNWTTVSATTFARRGQTSANIYFGLSAGFSGNVWFDNIRVVASGIRPLQAAILTPGNSTISETNGQITLAVYGPDLAGYDSRLAKLLVRRDGIVIAERDYLLRDDRIYADIGQLPADTYELELSIIDLHAKVTIGSCVMPLNVASTDRSVPNNAAMIDNSARLLINGAPFMPVGIYVSDPLEKTDMDALAASQAFNTVAAYRGPILRFTGSTQNDIGAIHEVLNYADAKNLKILFGLSDLLPETRGFLSGAASILGLSNPQRNWTPITTDADNTALMEIAVNSFKSHPALLGWYTQDEQDAARIPFLAARRLRINQLDPFHPVIGATFAGLDFPAYTPTWDIGSMDFYPVTTDLSDYAAGEFLKSTKSVADSMRLDDGSSLAWGITQCHNTGFYDSPTTSLRFPTVVEMRAMCLAQAIYGSKGFLFYAYSELKLNATPTVLGQRLNDVAAAAQTLRLFEPYLMSGQLPAAQPQLTISGGRVVARSFKHANGSIGVALSGFSNPNAVITMPAGTPELRSVYGSTTALGNRQYRFTGTGTQADLLMP